MNTANDTRTVAKQQDLQKMALEILADPGQSLTREQIELMRDAVLDNDHTSATNIDLSKPVPNPQAGKAPLKFPKILYSHTQSRPARDYLKPVNVNGVITQQAAHDDVRYVTKTVDSEEALEAAVKHGWSESVPVWDEDGKLVRAGKKAD